MDRLIAANSVDAAHADTAPATGTPGYATDGNPATNTPATQFPAYAFNALQEEVLAVIQAAGIAPNRNNNAQLLAAIQAVVPQNSPGRLLGVQIFTSNGTYTPGTYNGVAATMMRKRICGGGGGGGGAPTTTSSQVAVANGGNGGAYVEWIGPAASETVTIGAGGTAGTAGPNAGGAGGTTSAGSITAVGGFGGTTGGATTPPYINPGQANNGGGALGPSGGGNIIVSRGCSLGGYGLSVGLTGVIGGQGGDSAFSPSYKSASIPSTTSYGAGGGGAANGPSAAAAAGTIGRPGVVIYEEYA